MGAYERDNFGDLLFLLVTEQYLRNAQVISTAPFRADMTALLDREVHAYGPLLRTEAFDAIWTAGGQVGGTDLRSAFRMSAPARDFHAFERSPAKRAEILRRAVGDTPVESPYVPSPLSFPRNASAISVLNSVGLSGIRAAEPARRARLVALLRGTTHIAVRDQESSNFLAALGIEHRLVPDAVHAIGVLRPAERDPDSDVAIIQVSSSILRNLGPATVAAAIAGSRRLSGLRIRFLPAGTARGHDSVTDYRDLVARVKRSAPDLDAAVVEDRRPFDVVDHIRRARVVVGTSLHVRIVASAYGVPRVTLSRAKPTRYARTWDPGMPFDVSPAGLDDAVGAAVSRADRPEVIARSAELSRLAHDNLTDLADRVLTAARTETTEDKALRLKARQEHVITLGATERAARDSDVARLELELRRARRELAAIRSSRSYRLSLHGARVRRAIRRSLRRAG